jgi:hypothetical protein
VQNTLRGPSVSAAASAMLSGVFTTVSVLDRERLRASSGEQTPR